MKRITLLTLLFAASLAFGQGPGMVSNQLTSSASACQPASPGTACVFIPVGVNVNSVAITVAGTFSGTLQFEVSGDGGTTWVSWNFTPAPSGSAVSSTTSTGVWTANVASFSFVRVRCSAYTSGVATVTLNPSPAAPASAGGGSGTITGVTAGTGLTGGGSSGGVTLNFASGNIGATKAFLSSTMANTFSASYAAQTLPGLSFAVAANTNYVINCSFQYVVSGTNTGTPNFAITGPASPTQVSVNVALGGASAASVNTTQVTAASFPTQFGSSSTTVITVQNQGTMAILLQNGANAGTVQLQAGAQGTGTVTFTAGQSACVMI